MSINCHKSNYSSLDLDFSGLTLVDTPPPLSKSSEVRQRFDRQFSSVRLKSHLRATDPSVTSDFDGDEQEEDGRSQSEDERSHRHRVGINPGAFPSNRRCDTDDTSSSPSSSYSSHSSQVIYDSDEIQSVRQSEKDRKIKCTSQISSPSIGATTSDEKRGNHDSPTLVNYESKETDNTSWVYDHNKRGYYLHGKDTITEQSVQWPQIFVAEEIFKKLYPHQRIGVQWLASLHHREEQYGIGGGILADDMGLGKTLQTLTFIGGLMQCRSVRNALVVCPVSVLRSWEKEAKVLFERNGIGSNISVIVVDSNCRKFIRADRLQSAMACTAKYPFLVITTYGLVKQNKVDFLPMRDNAESKKLSMWDYVILDEGHIIKNHTTEQHKCCSRIASHPKTRRLLLTGTPIQNNLRELWSLFDWATSGKLFGKLQTFVNKYAIPIENGRHKNATESTLQIAERANTDLQSRLKTHFLQRMKDTEMKEFLTNKRELVVWTHLSQLQRHLYEKYLVDGGKVTAILSGQISSPLEAITWLKKLCGHPFLVDPSTVSPDSFLKHSAKLQVLLSLATRLNQSGHRFLIFSQSTKMLDIIQRVLPFSLARIDGKTKNRQSVVDSFNRDNSDFDGMILSTKAAGIGLTLTGADRAIIYDPSWNPADDSQAVDRCYRIGQSKNVTVYRLIAAGTVEERMYEKQVYKDGIRRTITSSGCVMERYFARDELTRLFQIMPAGECAMLERFQSTQKLVVGGSGKRSVLERHAQVVGVTSHDLIYVQEKSHTSLAPSKETRTLGRSANVLFQDNKGKNVEPLVMPSSDKVVLQGEPIDVLCDLFRKVDVLTETLNLSASLCLLLDATKLDVCRGPTRLIIHKKIVARAIFLGYMTPAESTCFESQC